jgi:hypothetical protein
MQSNNILRGRFLVNKPYQFRFIAEIMLVVILATTLSAGATYILMKGEMESEFYSSERKLENIREALPRILAVSSFVTLFAMTLVGGFITLRETHRVIGPVEKMERKFKEMTEGDYSYMVGFRKADVLKGLDVAINSHLNNLSDFFTNFDKMVGEIATPLTAIEKAEGDKGENLLEIRNLLAELAHYADVFRSH